MKQADVAKTRHDDDTLAMPGHALIDHGPTPRIDSEAILDGRRYVVIVHAGKEYQLRVTRNNKLILNR